MPRSCRLVNIAATVFLAGAWSASGAAADATWTATGGGSWSNGALWSTGVAPGSTASTTSADVATLGASISGSTRVDVTIDANRNVGGIVFNGTNNSLRFVGGQAVLLSAGGFLRAEDSITAETAAIRLQGDGSEFTLTSDSTATAGLTLGSLIGLSTPGRVTTVVLTGTGRGLAGNPADSAAQLQDGPNGGRLRVVKQGSGTWQIKLNNPWSGGLEVIEGEADVRGSNNPATNAILLGGTSGTASATLFYGNQSDIFEPITVRAGSSGTLVLRNDSGSTRRIRATTTLERAVTVEISSPTGSTAFQGNFAGEGDITKTGAGTMSMSGGTATQHAGSFIVSAGTLVADHVNATNIRNRIAVAAGAKLDVKQGAPIAGLDGAGQVDYTNTTPKTLRFGGSGSYDFSGSLLNTGTSALSLAADLKEGGVQVLSGSSSHKGMTAVRSGTLALGYATSDTSKLADNQILYLHGGRLELRGGSHVEAVGSTTINGGFSRLSRVGGSATIALGALTASGGGLDIESAGIATTTTTTNAGGLLAGSGRVTVGGSDWAVADAQGGIIPFTCYVTLAAGTAGNNATHYSLTGGAAGWSGNLAVRTLKITPTGPGQALDLGAGSLSVATTRSNGGLLFTGSDAYAITAARIQAGGDDEVVLHHHGGGTLSLPALNHKLVQFGTGPTLLTAPATGAAGLILSGGTVRFSDNAQLGTVTGTGVVQLWGGRLVADTSGGDISLVNAAAGGHRTVALGAADAAIDVVGGGTLTVAGVISTTSSNNVGGDTPLVIGGPESSGTVVLLGTNTFTGDTRLRGGTLSISADANLGNAAYWIDVAASATLATTSSLSSSRVVSLRADAEGRFAPAADTTLTLAGRVRGPGSLRTDGPGVLLLSGGNSFTGGTTLAAGVLELGSTAALGSTGAISFAGGTLRYGAGNASDYSGRFAAAGQPVAIDTGGRDVAFATGFGGAGGSLLKAGSGTLTLAADNTYTGTTTISVGTLKVGTGGTAGSLGATSAVTIAAGALLTFDRVDAYGGPLAAAISGAGGITVAGGTLTLSGDSSFTGSTTVAAGTLRAATATSLGRGNVAVAAGGTLEALATPALGTGAAIDVAAGGRLVVADGVSLPLAASASLADWRTLPRPTARQTEARILDGTAPAGGTNLTAAWLAAASGQFSDILSLSGTGAGNRFVLSLSLDPLLSAEDLSTLTIGRRAGSGDEFAAIGTTFMGLDQPWTSGFTTLGQYGIDTQTDTIWVVADANSQFVVMAVPEPELLPPLAAGLALAGVVQAVTRRRRGAAR
jgi:autotransporter-associated beta strand protein